MTTKETKVKKNKKAKAKRNGRTGKRPVLTSPWKIGIFVSLLLVFMSLGVGYYIVNFYDVDLKWIESGASGWSVNSMLFVNDMAPLAAAVVIVSLFAYFLIASAVHRYKFYLESGQDYRSMISLAESIDDLTNPAQIARLSQYPELQAVLRSYGDQIREISQDLGTKDTASNYAELKSEIESLLGGAVPAEDASEGSGAGSIYDKLRDRVEADRARIAELEQRNERERRAYGQAALAYGKAMEAISGAGEELLAITNAVAELTSVAERVGAIARGGAAAPKDAAGPRNRTLKSTFTDMEGAVRKLEEGGRALQEFSEENNGIAIQLALMAARGNVDEHALATFAERVRSTAERFHKLSGGVSSIAQGLLGNCYAIKEVSGLPAEPSESPVGADVSGAIVEIARRIENGSAALETRIMGLGSELHDVHELLLGDARNDARPAAVGAPAPVAHARPVAAAADDSNDRAGLVIDHGSSWGGVSARNDSGEAAESGVGEEQGFSFKNLDEMRAAFAQSTEPKQEAEPAREAAPPRVKKSSDFSDMTSLRNLDGATQRAWRTVEVEKTEVEDEAGRVDVTVQAAPETPIEEPEIAIEPASESSPADEKNDEDPVHDLFDLGAVEYVEESQIQR
jgi:hypothetical protein